MNLKQKSTGHAIRFIVIVTALIASGIMSTEAQVGSPKPVKTGYAPVNGVKMYYEIYGDGPPVLLLHGAYMTIGMNWNELLPELSKSRKVIAVELEGHGRSALTDRPFAYKSWAGDVSGLLKHLKIDSTDVIGYSLGGTIALEFAIQYPELAKKMVIISTVYKYTGWLPQVRELFQTFKPEMLDNTPLPAEYKKIAPKPNDWTPFVTRLMDFDKKDFDLGEDNMKKIKSPILYIMADNDGIDLKHKADMYELSGGNIFADIVGLPKSQLAIIPGTGHVSLMQETKALLTYIKPFLKLAQ